MKQLLYVHGLSSSGTSSTVKSLQFYLQGINVIAPDLPLCPEKALDLLHQICQTESPDLVMGTSMGGMFTQQMFGYQKILVNPAFHVSDFMRLNIGTQFFLNPRRDGSVSYEITPELCDAYQKIEQKQFTGITPYDIEHTYALFGKNDMLVRGYNEYRRYYKHALWYSGEHHLSEKDIREEIVPLVHKLLQMNMEE